MTLRFPRLTALKLWLSVPADPAICLVESPLGGSILMTSAPRSASSIAQKGPAITCVTSSTLRPASACGPRGPSPLGLISRLVPEGGRFVHSPYDLRRAGRRCHPDLQPSRRAQRDDVGDVRRACRGVRSR